MSATVTDATAIAILKSIVPVLLSAKSIVYTYLTISKEDTVLLITGVNLT